MISKIKRVYNDDEIFNSALVKWHFEFYTSNNKIENVAKSISKYTSHNVSINDLNSSKSSFILTKDVTRGGIYILTTSTLSYKDSRNALIKIVEWIRDKGYTTDSCSLFVKLAIDNDIIPTRNELQNINILKFILDFDEEKIYKDFPTRRDSVFAKSIKSIHPNEVFFYSQDVNIWSQNSFTIPNEDYYGVDFTQRDNGYLTYRYIGGHDYEKKMTKILDILNYFILHLHKTLNFVDFSVNDDSALKRIITEHSKGVKGFIFYKDFKKAYPKIKVTVDLKDDDILIESFWQIIRNKIYTFITMGALSEGFYNYDTEYSGYQLKDASVKNLKITDVEFINCNLEGIFEKCIFYTSTIKNSIVDFCEAPKENKFIASKITNTPLNFNNECENCYINNGNYTVNCLVNGGIIQSGEVGKLANISKETVTFK